MRKPLTKQYLEVSRYVTLLLLGMFCSVVNAAEVHPSSPPLQNQNFYATDSAQAWLSKMSSAFKTLNYQISFILLMPGADSQPYLWRHAVMEDGREMEQLNLLNGPGREMLRVDDRVSYFEPNVPPYSLQSKIINGPIPSEFFKDPLSLSDAYEFILVGRSRVAGRAAQQIRVISRDKSRYGFNLWLDQETGLILKLNMADLQGQLLEQIQVNDIQISADPHLYFSKVEVAKLPDVLTMGATRPITKRWQINYLPLGMHEVKRDVHRLPVTGNPVEYLMLSDGLVDISVYVKQFTQQDPEQNLVLRYQSDTLLTKRQGEVLVTVIGKLPAVTANAIASSIGPVRP